MGQCISPLGLLDHDTQPVACLHHEIDTLEVRQRKEEQPPEEYKSRKNFRGELIMHYYHNRVGRYKQLQLYAGRNFEFNEKEGNACKIQTTLSALM
jgi:hypothetical protein